VNRKQLVESILAHASTALPKTHVEAVLDALAITTKNALVGEEEVHLPGIGKFGITVRKPRTGRNPKTGESLQIAGKRVPRFTAFKTLKDACNGGTSPTPSSND